MNDILEPQPTLYKLQKLYFYLNVQYAMQNYNLDFFF